MVNAWDLRAVLKEGITAIVDLASNEAPIQLTRDVLYCRFPIVDGAGNDPVLLRLTIDTLVTLLRAEMPTFVFCSAGMSRTPLIAAAAISSISGEPLADCLAKLAIGHAHDIAPSLIVDVQQVLKASPQPS